MNGNRLLAIGSLLGCALAGFSGCGGSSTGPGGGEAPSQETYAPIAGVTGGTLNADRNLARIQKDYAAATITPAPWAGYWFPFAADGVADAASKYDALTNGTAADWERAHHGTGLPGVADWWGHCNGWTAAAILMPEPRAEKTIGSQLFSIGDRKALLSEMHMEATGDFIGTRVYDPDDFSSEAFNDVWPAQMYLVLTSVMGQGRRAVAIDRYTGYQVWNQPLVAYVTAPVKPEDFLGADPEFPNFYRVNMTTTIYWVSDGVSPDVLTPPFSSTDDSGVYESRTLTYELWLDAPPVFDGSGNLTSSGDIILSTSDGHTTGGIWKNGDLSLVESHPDYMWIPTAAAPSTGFKNPDLDDKWVLTNVR